MVSFKYILYLASLFHTIKINYFQRYSMELAYILIITLGVNILDVRFIFRFTGYKNMQNIRYKIFFPVPSYLSPPASI